MADTFRVLVVDDEAMMRDILSGLLEMEGYVVEVAEEGRSALAAIDARPPDAVVLDLNMPGVSGWQVIDQLKEHRAPRPSSRCRAWARRSRPSCTPSGDSFLATCPNPSRRSN